MKDSVLASYERRALSRRRSAIRDFDEARRSRAPLGGGLLPSLSNDASLADKASAHFGQTISMSNLKL
jgi:hypothetical protein